jgi:hypothetical protein
MLIEIEVFPDPPFADEIRSSLALLADATGAALSTGSAAGGFFLDRGLGGAFSRVSTDMPTSCSELTSVAFTRRSTHSGKINSPCTTLFSRLLRSRQCNARIK